MVIDENTAQVTAGEVFEDGTTQVVHDADHPDQLLLWHSNRKETLIAAPVERDGIVDQAPAIEPTIVRAMALPTRSAPCGPVRQLLDDIASPTLHTAALIFTNRNPTCMCAKLQK